MSEFRTAQTQTIGLLRDLNETLQGGITINNINQDNRRSERAETMIAPGNTPLNIDLSDKKYSMPGVPQGFF